MQSDCYKEESFKKIRNDIEGNLIHVYMKGSPKNHMCGFSERVANALSSCGAVFSSTNVLSHPMIRKYLPLYSNWPTFPQVYVEGELIGGCDIVMELYDSGELLSIVSKCNTKR